MRSRSWVDYAVRHKGGALPKAAPRFLLARRSGGGWSLAELTMVIVIMGVLAAVAVPAFRPREAQVFQVAERFRDDVRHAQMLALNLGRTLRLDVAANGYAVVCVASVVPPCNADPAPMFDPGTGQPFNVSIAAGGPLVAGFTITPIPAAIVFDPLGRPRNAGTNALIAGDVDYTFTGASAARVVRVVPITGFASVL